MSVKGVTLSNDQLNKGANSAYQDAIQTRKYADADFDEAIKQQNQGLDSSGLYNMGYQEIGESVNSYLEGNIKNSASIHDNVDDAIKDVQNKVSEIYSTGKNGNDMSSQFSTISGQAVVNGLVNAAASLNPDEFIRIANQQ